MDQDVEHIDQLQELLDLAIELCLMKKRTKENGGGAVAQQRKTGALCKATWLKSHGSQTHRQKKSVGERHSSCAVPATAVGSRGDESLQLTTCNRGTGEAQSVSCTIGHLQPKT